MLDEVSQLADEVLAPVKNQPETMTENQARGIKKAAGALYGVTVVLCVLLGITLLLNAFAANGVLGMRFFVEPSDAMLRQVPRGSLLITVTRTSDKIKPGDIITYYALLDNPGSRLTRIVHERQDSNGIPLFRTKRAGDAEPDSMLVNMTRVLGVKLAVIPYAGYVISFVQTYIWGFAVLAGALCVAAAVMRSWAKREHPGLKKRRQKKDTRGA